MRYEAFPDELPTDKLSILIDIARGRPVDKREAALAALNVIGFAAGRLLPPQDFGSVAAMVTMTAAVPTPDADELEAAVTDLHDELNGGTAKMKGPGALLIIAKFAIPILLRLLTA